MATLVNMNQNKTKERGASSQTLQINASLAIVAPIFRVHVSTVGQAQVEVGCDQLDVFLVSDLSEGI